MTTKLTMTVVTIVPRQTNETHRNGGKYFIVYCINTCIDIVLPTLLCWIICSNQCTKQLSQHSCCWYAPFEFIDVVVVWLNYISNFNDFRDDSAYFHQRKIIPLLGNCWKNRECSSSLCLRIVFYGCRCNIFFFLTLLSTFRRS